MLGYYNYTVFLTYIGLISGVSGIALAYEGNIQWAVLCLLFSGFCDMFDGKIARTKKDRTDDEMAFGVQIDSLCDIVCFGVLPAVIAFASGATEKWQIASAALFVLCGVIRLGYFNVTEENRRRSTDARRSEYSGLPITASAIALPLLMCFSKQIGSALPFAVSLLLTLLAVCYITPLNVKKPGLWGGALLLAAGLAVFIVIVIL